MKTKRTVMMLLCLFLCVVMGGEVLLSAFFITANAEGADIAYTNVYNDLTSDRSFNKEQYPLLFSSTSLENPSCSPILFLPFSE